MKYVTKRWTHIKFHWRNIQNPGKQDVNYVLYFNHILLVAGAGHMEINMLRALFTLCKPIILQRLVGLLGFCSKKAKDFIVNGGDHHLIWQIFQVMFHAL